MSKRSLTSKLVEYELAPGVFDSSHLPQFDESDAIVKRAHGNPGYFVNLDSSGSYEGAYWKVDTSLGDKNQRDLLSYIVLGSLGINTTNTLALESIDRLRKTIGSNDVALSALDVVSHAVNEKTHQDRQLQARKIGESIVQRLDYHLLVSSSRIGPDDYEIMGKFAHLRGIALNEEGSGVPVVFGESRTLGTLPNFQQTHLYRGTDK